jgi:fibronectin-binding autotransporter adhesin
MKYNRKNYLLHGMSYASGLVLFLSTSESYGASISYNFSENPGNQVLDTTTPKGPLGSPFWNDSNTGITGGLAAGSEGSLVDNSGNATSASISWSSSNTWWNGSGIGSDDAKISVGYLDDGGAGVSVNFTGIPYDFYNVYGIIGSDVGATYSSQDFQVNGAWAYGGSAATPGLGFGNYSGNWTQSTATQRGDYWKVSNVAGNSLTIQGQPSSGAQRGSLSAVIVEEATGVAAYWDANGATAGSGGATPAGTWDSTSTNWNDSVGTGTPATWPSGLIAVLSAGTDASGAYTITVDGTQSASYILAQDNGSITLTGGALNLTSSAGIVASGSSSVTVNSDLTGETNLTVNGNAVTIGAANTLTGSFAGQSSTFAMTAGSSFSGIPNFSTGSPTVATSATLTNATVSTTASFNVQNGSLALAGTSIATTTGSANVNRGTLQLSGSSSLSASYFGNPTANTASTVNIQDSASVSVSGSMTFGDQGSATITVNQSGGSVTNTGTTNNPGGNNISNRWGHWGGGATVYNLSGGTLNLPGSPLYLSWDGSASLNISGTGVANIKGFDMGYAWHANASAINLDAGGVLNVGSDGIVSGYGGTANKSVNLNGGTLAASASWSGTVPLNVTANSVIDTSGGTITISGALNGASGDVTVQGGGTLALVGGGAHTGTVQVSSNNTVRMSGNFAGNVAVASGATLSSGTATTPGSAVLANATLSSGSKSSLRVGTTQDLIDVLDLNVASSHTITVTPVGDIANGTSFTLIDYLTISSGGYDNVNIVPSSSRMNITKNPDDGSAIGITVNGFDSLIWKGTDGGAPNSWDVNTTQNWQTTFTNVGTKFLANDVVLFDDSAATGDVTLSGTIAPVSVSFDNETLAYNLTGSGITSGSVTKDGAATTILATANTYTGLTKVLAGTLVIGNGTVGSLAAASAVELDAGELRLNLPAAGSYTNPTLALAGSTIRIIGSGDMVFSPVITNASGADIVFNRDGVVYCNSANQTTGSITIDDGKVVFDGAQQTNRLAINKLVTVNNGATLAVHGVNAFPTAANGVNVQLNGGTYEVQSGGSNVTGAEGDSHSHVNNLTMSGGTVVLSYSGTGTAYNNESVQLNGVLTVTGTTPSEINFGAGADATNAGLSLNGSRIFDVEDVTGSPAADLTINAEVQNNDSAGDVLVKQGAGTLLLAGPNSYSGGNEVLAGVLSASTVANDAVGGIGNGYLAVKNNATFRYTGNGNEVTTRNLWLDNGGAVMDIVEATADLTFSPAGGAVTAPVTKLGAGSLTIGSVISGAAAITVEAGILATSGVNTYSGDTTVNGGTLIVNGSSIPDFGVLSIAATAVVDVAGNEMVSELNLNGVKKAAGTYGATGSGATNIDDVHFAGTGVITVIEGYAAWKIDPANGLTAGVNDGAAQDPDQDGISNLLEYALGGAPLGSSQSILPQGAVTGGNLVFTFKRSDASEIDTTQVVQYGSDLAGWTDVNIGAASAGVVTIVENADAEDDVTVTIPMGANTKLFARLAVTED